MIYLFSNNEKCREFAQGARAHYPEISFYFSKFNIRRIRLVGRGRTIGNRVTCNRVPEFESLILRQINRDTFSCSCLFYIGAELDEIRLCSRRVANRVRKSNESRRLLASVRLVVTHSPVGMPLCFSASKKGHLWVSFFAEVN